jgi:hypothetical protein
LQVFVDVDAHHFVGCKKAIFDALLKGVGIDRFAKVINAGHILGFLALLIYYSYLILFCISYYLTGKGS